MRIKSYWLNWCSNTPFINHWSLLFHFRCIIIIISMGIRSRVKYKWGIVL
jgi:hypothetical protein